jgi:hypothetical protein
MKKLVILSVLLLLAVFILLPAVSNGKFNVSKPAIADGYPLPPPIPPGPGNATLVADGYPLPPPIPPGPGNATLVADGYPLPPPIPPSPASMLAAASYAA